MELDITFTVGVAAAFCVALLVYGAWLCLSQLGDKHDHPADEPAETGDKP